jgi:hypothetical protein
MGPTVTDNNLEMMFASLSNERKLSIWLLHPFYHGHVDEKY